MKIRPVFYGFILFGFLCNSSLAETYVREYSYKALDIDSEETSRTIAVDHTRTLLFEKIGGHIEQMIKVSEDDSINSYARADVEAVTADLSKISILEEKWDGSSYFIKAEIEADTRRIVDTLREYKTNLSEESRQQMVALKANERALKKSREIIAHLGRELELEKNSSRKNKLLADYTAELEKLSSEEMFSTGFDHYQQAEYTQAIDWYRKAAARRNVVAQSLLGMSYMKGQGVEKDLAIAFDWFRKAAEQDDAIAQYYLGMMYLDGNGVKRDEEAAADWLHKSAEQGNALAQYQLGEMYLKGKGVEQKDYMAAHWLRKAGQQGVATAQLQLGNLYRLGKGVTKNKEEALYWYHKAAEQGLGEAREMIEKVNSEQ
jgi:TPR repeat protein